MDFERARMANLFAVAQQAGPYGELPIPPLGFDPQIHASRNDRPQPFFLICARDTVIATLSGEGSIEFRDAPVLEQLITPGDFVYVPAGTPHRVLPDAPMTQIRYKALDAGLEGVEWCCPECDAELWRREFDTAREIPQRAYLDACREFNEHDERRCCSQCGTTHPPVDLSGFRWAEIAEVLEGERDPT